MLDRSKSLKLMLGAGCALSVLAAASGALAEDRTFNLPASDAVSAIPAFAQQAGLQIIAPADQLKGVSTPAIKGRLDTRIALNRLISQTGLHVASDDGRTVTLAADPQGAGAGGGAETNVVQELIVTAQKKEEAIQTVPIAISAFTQKSLEEQHIEGGFDLLKAIPNVTFSKNNFTSYNFSIRGIGTKAVSATTDPGVAVSFNNASLIQNRLFEQEYFDVERVEVLRGPQGTLYGRNATAGVINVISAKPDFSKFAGSIKGEVGNYHSKRVSAMVNVPLIDDKLAVRFAGALTNRQGYDFNDTTKHAVNGRDLWSARLTVGFNPTERLRTSLVWERFNEDDNRSRTGKQLCKRDPGPEAIGSAPIGGENFPEVIGRYFQGAFFSQGCSPVSLYDESAFQTPNGYALPFIAGAIYVNSIIPLGLSAEGTRQGLLARDTSTQAPDVYAGILQSRDLRVINSFRDPKYRAKADIFQLNIDFDLTNQLAISSQTTYNKDQVYSFQDYNRFNTNPIFADTSGLNDFSGEPSSYRTLAPGGIYCDPQLGCSNTIAGFDISQAKGSQFLQEVRLQSDFSGPLNFSAGVNYTRFNVVADYYVMFNLITAIAQVWPFNRQGDPSLCNRPAVDPYFVLNWFDPPAPIGTPGTGCPYIDPNPVDKINGEGHNYFRSKNPYKLQSSAVFGEVYWQVSDALKITAGARYTDDRKAFTPVPSQLLLGENPTTGGDVNRGYPELPAIKQHWGEVTGRLGVDWKPDLSFTDQTMLYAFYSRGYKGGGANPPGIGFTQRTVNDIEGYEPGAIPEFDFPPLEVKAQNITPTFKPEFVNAFEVGAKNTLLGGSLVVNGDAFFYDYKDYQVSKIVDRSAANENFDAKVWGVELETVFSPARNLRFVGNLGYLDTRIGKGAKSIDLMNRTQGNPDWVLVRPWLQFPSSCIAPKQMIEQALLEDGGGVQSVIVSCGQFLTGRYFHNDIIDPRTGVDWDPLARDENGNLLYPDINGGAGFAQDLEGKELPNSPHWTANLGAQYGVEFAEGWKATIRADGYWQSQSWARVYNAVNDKLHGWYNANLSLWVENDSGLKIEIYAKNILDKTPITDAFINSDDTALTTNVFVLDPRLIGVSITKTF